MRARREANRRQRTARRRHARRRSRRRRLLVGWNETPIDLVGHRVVTVDNGRVRPWLSGRYSSVVCAFDAASGRLLARIPVGRGPHGLCVYPQPGRYSLGHTGVFR
jgi:hypothetical protein